MLILIGSFNFKHFLIGLNLRELSTDTILYAP